MITLGEIQKIASLSKLRLNEETTEILFKELGNIIGLMDDLASIDCNNVEPLTSVLEMNQRFRDDNINLSDSSTEILSNSPGKDAALAQKIKCFIVPKVVE